MYITSHNININEENMNQTCGTVVLNNNNNNNNNIVEDFNNSLLESKTKKLISMCFGCGTQITDQFILRVAPDLEWHAKCLKCSECGQYLDENCTCFVRNGKLFCKNDYLRLFSKKCFKCNDGFKKNDFVMRANNRIYHVDCFRCYMCNKPLAPGDEFAPRDDGLLCKTDNDLFEKHSLNNNNISNNNTSSLISMQPAASSSLASSSSSSSSSTTSSSSSSSASSSSSNSSSSSPNINTSCQNITNLQQHTNIMQKCVVDDLNVNTNDFEDNQNCLSPNQLHQQQQQQQQYHLLNSPHSRIGLIQPHHQAQQLQNPNNSNSSTASTSSTSSSSSTAGNNPNLGHHQSSSGGGTSGSGGGGHHRKDKTTRVRTVLNEKQLHTLRTCYGANPRPDALMKEQLVEMTGLSPRVIRVWFQNKRCKDKKKTILIKQMQEQQKNRQTIGHGIPLIAGSPLRNDINNLGQGSQIEMQHTTNAYHHHHQSSHALSWKQMTEGFSLNGQIMTDSMNGGPSGLNNQNGMSMQQLQQQQHQQQQQQHSNYDQMMGFQSDEEDCFDQLSDQGGDDSVSSVGLDDTRIQQL